MKKVVLAYIYGNGDQHI